VLAGKVYLAQDELGRTAYLADKGQVDPTYEDVREYLRTVFPYGMSRSDVLRELDQNFRHKIIERAGSRSLYVVFPGRSCSDEDLLASPSSCRYLIGYAFYFSNDSLANISACDPPCEQWSGTEQGM